MSLSHHRDLCSSSPVKTTSHTNKADSLDEIKSYDKQEVSVKKKKKRKRRHKQRKRESNTENDNAKLVTTETPDNDNESIDNTINRLESEVFESIFYETWKAGCYEYGDERMNKARQKFQERLLKTFDRIRN